MNHPIPTINFERLINELKRKCKLDWLSAQSGIGCTTISNYCRTPNPTKPSFENGAILWNIAIRELDAKVVKSCIETKEK